MQMRDQREINADPATVYAALLAPQTIPHPPRPERMRGAAKEGLAEKDRQPQPTPDKRAT